MVNECARCDGCSRCEPSSLDWYNMMTGGDWDEERLAKHKYHPCSDCGETDKCGCEQVPFYATD